MAGIGRWPVPVPDKVKISVRDGKVAAQGAKGQLEIAVDPCVIIQVKDEGIIVSRTEESRRAKAIHGMTRKLIANMVEGVSAIKSLLRYACGFAVLSGNFSRNCTMTSAGTND